MKRNVTFTAASWFLFNFELCLLINVDSSNLSGATPRDYATTYLGTED